VHNTADAGCESLVDLIPKAKAADGRIQQPVPAVNPWLPSFPKAKAVDGRLRHPVPAVNPWLTSFPKAKAADGGIR
jgi:hypothetical protein